MDDVNSLPKDPTLPPPHLDEMGALRALANAIKNRILSGLLAVLPIVVTIAILGLLYRYLQYYVIDLPALGARKLLGDRVADLPDWWVKVVSPIIATALVLAILYVLGYFVRSRIARAIDWVLLHLPIVTVIYKNVRTVFSSLGGGGSNQRFKRVVLIDYPSRTVRSLGFVTRSLRDVETQRTILCVCVLTGVMPPSGFTFFVPEDEVTDVDWTVQETLQTIVSGGLTAPSAISFFSSAPTKLIVPGPPAGPPAGDAVPQLVERPAP